MAFDFKRAGLGAATLGVSELLRGNSLDPNAFGNASRPGDPRFRTSKTDPGEFEAMLRKQALQQGPTASTLRNAGSAAQLAQTSAAQGFSNLAQQGGASAGARERLQKQANLQSLLGRQGAFAAGEEEKGNLQKSFASQEAAERQAQNQFELEQYRAKLAEFAAQEESKQQIQLAQRTGGLGGKGGFLGLGF